MTNITTWPVPNLGKVGGKPTSLMGVYRFRTPRGDVLLGFYQNFEATPDNICTSGQRRLLTPSEAMTYCTEGTLPVDFETRPLISGGFKKDEAKDVLKGMITAKDRLVGVMGGTPTMAPVVAPVEQPKAEEPKAETVVAPAVVKPAIDKTAIIVAALAAGKSNDEVLALIAALG